MQHLGWGILESGPNEIGKMLAGISKKLADSSIPDMSSDLAIYKNMYEIDFYSKAGLNFRKMMPFVEEDINKREKSLCLYNYYSQSDRRSAERYDKILSNCEAISANGVTGRIAMMRNGAYTPGAPPA